MTPTSRYYWKHVKVNPKIIMLVLLLYLPIWATTHM